MRIAPNRCVIMITEGVESNAVCTITHSASRQHCHHACNAWSLTDSSNRQSPEQYDRYLLVKILIRSFFSVLCAAIVCVYNSNIWIATEPD